MPEAFSDPPAHPCTCEGHPGRGGLVVEPEGHPADADDHEGGHVDRHDIVGQLTLEHHIHGEAAVFA